MKQNLESIQYYESHLSLVSSVVLIVLIWDDAAKKFVMELTFGLPVISVRLRRDKYADFSHYTVLVARNTL